MYTEVIYSVFFFFSSFSPNSKTLHRYGKYYAGGFDADDKRVGDMVFYFTKLPYLSHRDGYDKHFSKEIRPSKSTLIFLYSYHQCSNYGPVIEELSQDLFLF